MRIVGLQILGLKIIRLRILGLKIIRMRIAGGGVSGEAAARQQTMQRGLSIARSRLKHIDRKDECSLFFFCRPHALDPPRHDADISKKKTSAYMNLQ